MHSNPAHLSFLLLPPSAYAKLKQNQKTNKNNLSLWAVVWPSESHSISVSPYIFTFKRQLKWVIGLDRGTWLLLYHLYWPLLDILMVPRVAKNLKLCIYLSGPSTCSSSSRGNGWWGLVLVQSLGDIWFGHPASFPSLSSPGWVLQHWQC